MSELDANINSERLEQAAAADDGSLDFLDTPGDSSPAGGSEAGASEPGGNELAPAKLPEDDEGDDTNEDTSDSDADSDAEESGNDDPADDDAGDVDAPDNGPDGDEDEAPEIDPAKHEEISAKFAESEKAVEQEVEKRFADVERTELDSAANSRWVVQAQAARQAINAATAELEALEAKYNQDEDGYTPPMSIADTRRAVQLENAIARGESAIETIKQEMQLVKGKVAQSKQQALAEARTESAIQANMEAYPVLKQYEDGFRKAISRGYSFDNVREAITVAKALVESGKAPGKSTPRPKAGQVEQAALESSIADKKAGAITAGKGSTGTKGAAAKTGNPYKGKSAEVAEGLSYWDNEIAMAEAEARR